MPRAWYSYNGGGYDLLSSYELITNPVTHLPIEPTCNSNNNICAIYAIGDKVSGVQSFNPSDITFPRSLFATATSQGASQPTNGGNNSQGKPYYVRVKP